MRQNKLLRHFLKQRFKYKHMTSEDLKLLCFHKICNKHEKCMKRYILMIGDKLVEGLYIFKNSIIF